MTMNIRGLIMDDPEHTIHLQTLKYVAHATPSTEFDRVLGDLPRLVFRSINVPYHDDRSNDPNSAA